MISFRIVLSPPPRSVIRALALRPWTLGRPCLWAVFIPNVELAGVRSLRVTGKQERAPARGKQRSDLRAIGVDVGTELDPRGPTSWRLAALVEAAFGHDNQP